MRRKEAKVDFLSSDLPSNRKEVFFDCLKNRYGYLINCGIIMFLFSIPLFVLFFIKSIYLGALNQELNNGTIMLSDYNAATFRYIFIYDMLVILSSFILSIGLSGVIRIIRQISWIEPLFFLKDFTDGIKMNYKHISIHLFIISLLYMISDLTMHAPIDYNILKYIPALITIFIILPVIMYNIVQTSIYNMTLIEENKNSMLLFFKSVPVCVIFSVIISITLLLNLINNYTIKSLIFVLFLIILFPVFYISWFLYSSSVLDKYINNEYYPDIVDKGIVRKK